MDSAASKIAEFYGCELLKLRTSNAVTIKYLTNIANKYVHFASRIVCVIEKYLKIVHHSVQLPVLYLMDSIIKNVNKPYAELFSRNIVESFSYVLEASFRDQKRMYALRELRNSWTQDLFEPTALHKLDEHIKLVLDRMRLDAGIARTKAEVLQHNVIIAEQEASPKNQASSIARKRPLEASEDCPAGGYKRIKVGGSMTDDDKENKFTRNGSLGADASNFHQKGAPVPQVDPAKLFQHLLRAGLVTPVGAVIPQNHAVLRERPVVKEKDLVALAPKDTVTIPQCRKQLMDTLFDNLKQKDKNQASIDALYRGQECSNCGKRFKSGEEKDYQSHLDWHFRQNRQVKHERRKSSRAWFGSVPDWVKCDSAEELSKGSLKKENVEILPSVKDIGKRHCYVCKDAFESFFNNNEEEWHLKPAVCHGNLFMHPICRDDYVRKR